MQASGRGIFLFVLSSFGCIADRPFQLEEPVFVLRTNTKPLCASVDEPGVMRCHARTRTDDTGRAVASSSPIPGSLQPSDLQRAYAIPNGGAGMTIAIIAASDNPNAEPDMAVYRAQFGLPACTARSGCFRQINQRGQASPLPTPDDGWAGEISLDLDMVSATCPACRILLVEADTPTDQDLGAAVNTAVSLGADIVSMSFGGPENADAAAEAARYYDHPGVLLLAAGGDDGYDPQNVEFPAAAPNVLAVGGTSLRSASGTARGFTEAVWNSNGGASNSGCSKLFAKPDYQPDTRCTMRTLNDVAAFADPEPGVAVYDSYDLAPGWGAFGGTSAATPIVAGIFAVTGNARAAPGFVYENVSAFFDITSGNDVPSGPCTDGYLCSATIGYDGPTGVGRAHAAALANFAVATRAVSRPALALPPLERRRERHVRIGATQEPGRGGSVDRQQEESAICSARRHRSQGQRPRPHLVGLTAVGVGLKDLFPYFAARDPGRAEKELVWIGHNRRIGCRHQRAIRRKQHVAR